MNAFNRLTAARSAAMQGLYAEALSEYVWFHHHALAEQPAVYGVRLSFALGYWKELADVYPEALRVLEQIRDEKAAALLRGDTGIDTFRDVEAINRELDVTVLTYGLYKQIAEAHPALAAQCAQAAMPAIVEAGDYVLAGRLLPDPETSTRSDAKRLNEILRIIKHRAHTSAPRRWAEIRGYVEDVQRTLAVLHGNGLHDEAARIKALAIASMQSPSVRKAVTAEFKKPSPAPGLGRRSRRAR